MLRRHYILPTEHGAWIWWIGPLLIGLAAAGQSPSDALLLFLAALCAFLLRQPATIVVKALTGRRSRTDLTPAASWLLLDSVLLASLTGVLVARGHGRILLLAVPGAAVFAWHLFLISRREERGQIGIEVVGSGTLALAAPAAYWVAGGTDSLLPWLLWFLCWLQSSASIVLVYFRLGMRKLDTAPPAEARARAASRSLAYHGFNLALGLGLAAIGTIPGLMALAYGVMLLDAVDGLLRPPVGAAPTRIGLRQLLASSSFVLLSALGFLLRFRA